LGTTPRYEVVRLTDIGMLTLMITEDCCYNCAGRMHCG